MVPNLKMVLSAIAKLPVQFHYADIARACPMSAGLKSNEYWASCVRKEKSNALNPAVMRSGRKKVNDPINGIINGYFRWLGRESIFQ